MVTGGSSVVSGSSSSVVTGGATTGVGISSVNTGTVGNLGGNTVSTGIVSSTVVGPNSGVTSTLVGHDVNGVGNAVLITTPLGSGVGTGVVGGVGGVGITTSNVVGTGLVSGAVSGTTLILLSF